MHKLACKYYVMVHYYRIQSFPRIISAGRACARASVNIRAESAHIKRGPTFNHEGEIHDHRRVLCCPGPP